MTGEARDFFISYNSADKQAAVWIAWVLEEEGFTTHIQEWDFKAGGNFALEMDMAARHSRRTIAVVSQNYLEASFTSPEWAEKFAADPQGFERLLVPVRIEPCEIKGLLKQIIYIDLVDLDEQQARQRLLAELQPGRTKPAMTPRFPGFGAPAGSRGGVADSPAPVRWRTVERPATARWLGGASESRYANATLELHTLLTDPEPLEARTLRDLPGELAALGRSTGLFEQNEQLHTDSKPDHGLATTSPGMRGVGERGILVYRDREIVT
ncbi:toll/interleukin-1 receptor domain-containing protein [Nocardia sp. NPDC057353]|uniref:toll/interleukin-1 receptor domain-containing protein n=1 Tax=Nocardia sp. NPDC057353 TaxID=3346104 RepID=UPI003636E4B6